VAYLISYIVENLLEEGFDQEGRNIAECQIYGGEARAIVAAEYNVEDTKSHPTDLDLRFKIGLKSFESCRDVVERFLVWRLMELTPNADPQLIRQCYCQKQVVIGTDFSMLSIGDPVTGRNLDLEFIASTCSTRCFFNDANAFVIPLPCDWVRAMTSNTIRGQQEGPQFIARSLSAPWQTAVDYIRNGQLNIEKPELVFNGLPLYAHALSDKQLTPERRALENSYGFLRPSLSRHRICARQALTLCALSRIFCAVTTNRVQSMLLLPFRSSLQYSVRIQCRMKSLRSVRRLHGSLPRLWLIFASGPCRVLAKTGIRRMLRKMCSKWFALLRTPSLQ